MSSKAFSGQESARLMLYWPNIVRGLKSKRNEVLHDQIHHNWQKCKSASVDLSSQVSKGQNMRCMELQLLRDPNVATLKEFYAYSILQYATSNYLQIKIL